MKKEYPVYRKDILSGKVFPRKERIRLTKQGRQVILSRENPGNQGRGIYLHPSHLTDEKMLEKKRMRFGPETDFGNLYREVRKWKPD